MRGALRAATATLVAVGLSTSALAAQAPIDVGDVVGPYTSVTRLQLTLPAGWTPERPDDVHADSRFGSYASTYAQEGRVVRLERRVAGRKGTEPKEALGELIEWLDTVSKDDVGFIVLKPAA
jgi:hypothetical protein